MNLLYVALALLLEQLRPLEAGRVLAVLGRVTGAVAAWLTAAGRAGERAGQVAWLVLVPGAMLFSWLVWQALCGVSPILGGVFNGVVLYTAIAYHRETRLFAAVLLALSTADHEGARAKLEEWRGERHPGAGASEMARLAIEQGLVAGHRWFFGPVFWFALLPGPLGAVMYRMSHALYKDWGGGPDGRVMPFGRFSVAAFAVIDALPARATALSYAVIGNFEDALYCWRTQSARWPDRLSGILVASGAGALGVRLGLPVHGADGVIDRPEVGTGHKAEVIHMQRAAQLVWRVLVLWMLILALLGVAGWVSR
ncbi:MAG: CobD/CbiB family protein [Rhodocyclaceae bacterium]